jgi:single-stranded-DNA-specific exonuclease
LGVKPGVGSARSVPGFDLHAALCACSDHLLGHGGHAAAAGLKIEEANFEAFRAAFYEQASAEIAPEHRQAELLVDAEAPLSAFTLQAVEQIEQLAPFGQGNARPMMCTTGATLAEPPRTIGEGGRHLAIKLTQHGVTMRGVAFGGGEWAEELKALNGPMDVVFRPIINHFRGRRSVELQLVDWQPTPCC